MDALVRPLVWSRQQTKRAKMRILIELVDLAVVGAVFGGWADGGTVAPTDTSRRVAAPVSIGAPAAGG
jgi:hypothetical protein